MRGDAWQDRRGTMRRSGYDSFARLEKAGRDSPGARPARASRPNRHKDMRPLLVGAGVNAPGTGVAQSLHGRRREQAISTESRSHSNRASGQSRDRNERSVGNDARQAFVQDEYDRLEFDTDGLHERTVSVLHPFDAAIAVLLAERAKKKTLEIYPIGNAHNDEADAFRHAYWNFLMARRLGAERA